MRIEILPLEFLPAQGALMLPKDVALHDLAVAYCQKNLAEDVNLGLLSKCWVAVEMEGDEYRQVHGISGFVWKLDIPLFRVTGENAQRVTKHLIDRMRGFFQDNGARGSEVFLHISGKETPEQRCPAWQESLKAVGAEPADRFSVKV